MAQQQHGLPGLDIEPVLVANPQHPHEKALFEQMLGHLPWANIYLALLQEGWGWRKAAYIAWASIPASERIPQNIHIATDGTPGFASIIGLRDGSAISRWRMQNPAIDLAVRKLQLSMLNEATPRIMDALIESASNPSYKHAPDRKVALEMAGLYTPKSIMGLHDAAGSEAANTERLSDEDLARMAGTTALSTGGDDDE